MALFEDGYLALLEGFTYTEPWPLKIGRFELRYIESESSTCAHLEKALAVT